MPMGNNRSHVPVSLMSVRNATAVMKSTSSNFLIFFWKVGVIPKEGWACGAYPLFFWYDTDFLDLKKNEFCFFLEKSVSYQKKGGHVLLLVWQRLRTLGTFLRDAAPITINHARPFTPIYARSVNCLFWMVARKPQKWSICGQTADNLHSKLGQGCDWLTLIGTQVVVSLLWYL